MEEEKYLHWRSCTDLTHLRAESFAPNEERVLTIKQVKKEKITSNSGTVEEKPVAEFYEKELPMVLNVTNCKTIESLYGTGNVYEWTDKKIQVFATKTKVAGQSVPCLRVRNFIPKTNEVEYKCSVCGKTISKETYEKSIAKFGKAYCGPECYKTDTQGEDIL